MADLDDFFAKKDRKKSKTKKFSTTDEVAKKLEDTSKKPEKPVKKERIQQEGEGDVTETHEQDEWRDFEEEKKDYTGLKIGNLTINPESDSNNGGQDNNYEQQQTTYDEAGNEVEKKVGPWKKMSDGAEQQLQQQQQQRSEEKKTETAATPNVVGGTYVPPGKRNQQSQPQTIQPSRLRSKTAPDIHNEEYFPTLSGTKDQKRGRNEGSFEMVAQSKSNSLRYVEQTKTTGQQAKLSLGNRYNTLSSNDS